MVLCLLVMLLTDADKKANIMAQMVVTMTRVNGVYERVRITFQFVHNFDIIYYDGLTDVIGT
jgi:hypothetical protein